MTLDRAIRTALALTLTSCANVIPSEAVSGILEEERVCTGTPPAGEDSECIGLQASSCSCNSGGSLTAVNVAFVDDIEARRAAAGPAPCPAEISDDETCCADGAACSDGRCELLGPRGRSLVNDCGLAVDPNDPNETP